MAEKGFQQRSKKQNFQGKKRYQPYGRKHGGATEKAGHKNPHVAFSEKKKRNPAEVDFEKLYAEMTDSESDGEPQSSASKPQVSKSRSPSKSSRFSTAQKEYKKNAEKKQMKYKEMKRRTEEKEAALQRYRQKKKEKFLKFTKHTAKGQPVMKYQMQYIVKKLEREYKERMKQSS